MGCGARDGALNRTRARARMTVLADHGAPLGVPTWRAFNSAAAARADIPANSERIGVMACRTITAVGVSSMK